MKKNLFLLALAAALPLALSATEQLFYVSFASRVLIYAIAATSLNLVLGYGGMISFGHAAFVGTGAYAASIVFVEGATSAWLAWPAAVAASAAAAWLIGAVSLRTRGVYFIMITLAFAQMTFFLVNSMKAYGGDEGLSLPRRPDLGFGLDAGNEVVFYYVVLALLAAALILLHRLSRARFGRAIQAIRDNEARAEAVGFPVFRYKLACFVIAGALAGVAGWLAAAQDGVVNPEMLSWHQSGQLLMMVILGGSGTLAGPLVGATALKLLELVLQGWTKHWQLALGVFIILAVLLLPRGLSQFFSGRKLQWKLRPRFAPRA
jgi:branched-chain amino acid transport system permease protein